MKNEQELQNFCKNITLLRKRHGLSKKEMAKLLGIGIWSLNKIERGELPPRLNANVILAVYRQFGVRPSMLFVLPLSAPCGAEE